MHETAGSTFAISILKRASHVLKYQYTYLGYCWKWSLILQPFTKQGLRRVAGLDQEVDDDFH